MRWYREHYWTIVIILGTIDVALLLLTGSPFQQDLGLNVLSEAFGIFLTIIIIDSILKRRELKRNYPQRIANYRQVVKFSNHIIKHWVKCYSHSTKKALPDTIEGIFNPEVIKSIISNINLDSNVPKLEPPIKWFDYMVKYANGTRALGERILNRSTSLEAGPYGWIIDIMDGKFIIAIAQWPSVRNAPKLLGLQGPVKFNFTVWPSQEECDLFLSLYRWSIQEAKDLRVKEVKDLPYVYDSMPVLP